MTTATKEKPILFSTPMVRAILDGRKTQTRRIVKPQPTATFRDDAQWYDAKADLTRNCRQYARDCCPYGAVGDRLWVREAFQLWRCDAESTWKDSIASARDVYVVAVHYLASHGNWSHDWRPSIHMPRWASRITLEITDVRVERVQDISEADVAAEGFPFSSDLDQFKDIWRKINGTNSWNENPWVWAISFKVLP